MSYCGVEEVRSLEDALVQRVAAPLTSSVPTAEDRPAQRMRNGASCCAETFCVSCLSFLAMDGFSASSFCDEDTAGEVFPNA
jgi:hypothetical protein